MSMDFLDMTLCVLGTLDEALGYRGMLKPENTDTPMAG